MRNLLNKEMRLAASPLSYIFILFAFMTLIPGYPILVGAFFICFGIFHSFQSSRENNDILYTVLLPVKKTDAVKAKYTFTVGIQMVGFALSSILTVVRMTALANSIPYVNNVMMNANQAYLAYMLLIFALFNLIFVDGFFETAYKFARPFLLFCISAFIVVGLTETLHHIPGLMFLNDTATLGNGMMWITLVVAAVAYFVVTGISCKSSMSKFEKIDL